MHAQSSGCVLRPAMLLAWAGFAAVASQIDPAIYARLLNNNFPMFEAVTTMLKSTQPSTVLDLGTGPGEPAVSIAKAFPSAKVTATDVQEGMLAKARVRAEGLNNIDFRVASADDLSQFADGSFEAVTMIYALMFVPDREKCLKEIARVLKPGGRAYIATWKNLKFFEMGMEIVAKLMKRTPPPPPINPMALSAPNSVEDLLAAAVDEVSVVSVVDISSDFFLGSAEELCDAALIIAGPYIKTLIDEGVTDAKEQFCQAWSQTLDSEGAHTEKGYFVNDNIAQLMTVVKARQEL